MKFWYQNFITHKFYYTKILLQYPQLSLTLSLTLSLSTTISLARISLSLIALTHLSHSSLWLISLAGSTLWLISLAHLCGSSLFLVCFENVQRSKLELRFEVKPPNLFICICMLEGRFCLHLENLEQIRAFLYICLYVCVGLVVNLLVL